MSAAQIPFTASPDPVDSLEALLDFVDALWLPSDSQAWSSNLDNETIQKIYTDLKTVEDLSPLPSDELNDGSSISENPFLRERSASYNSSDYHFSSSSVTPSSSDDADDGSFNFQEWYIQDAATGKARPPKLLEFLHLLLNKPRYSAYASWVNKADGLFRIDKPDEVSTLWQTVKIRRTKGSMNYDTFARGIRYYYKSGLMLKTHTKRTYCFAQARNGSEHLFSSS